MSLINWLLLTVIWFLQRLWATNASSEEGYLNFVCFISLWFPKNTQSKCHRTYQTATSYNLLYGIGVSLKYSGKVILCCLDRGTSSSHVLISHFFWRSPALVASYWLSTVSCHKKVYLRCCRLPGFASTLETCICFRFIKFRKLKNISYINFFLKHTRTTVKNMCKFESLFLPHSQ